MTNEEAIKRIQDFTGWFKKDSDIYEALDIATQALSQEPCDDAVSREAILSKFKEVCFSKEWTQFRVDNGSHGQRDFLINYIEQLPSVTQKLGKWIPNYYFYGIYDYTCSECEKHSKEQSEFCPKCGAKMVEPQESEE